MLPFLGVLLGILLLIAGGTSLVTGASQIATRLGVSPMIVGLTIVGFGTSAPELVVNVVGAMQGESGLAFGNVIGSNISNLALVLGAAAVFHTIDIHGTIVRREVPLLLLITTIIMIMALDEFLEGSPSQISRSDSLVLLLLFGIFVYIAFGDFLRRGKTDPLLVEMEGSPMVITRPFGRFHWLLVMLGFALLIVGGQLTVHSGVQLATTAGVSTTVIGLFVLAIGTSMPELVTSIVAALRKEPDLALGNIVGSNIFNSLIVLPASGLVAPVVIPAGGLLDIGVSWLLAVALIPAFLLGNARVTRGAGVFFLLAYLAYVAVRLLTMET